MATEKQMAELVNHITQIRTKKTAMQKLYEDMIADLEERLRFYMSEAGVATVTGAKFVARTKAKTTVNVTDWYALQQYVIRNSAFDVLQKRITEGAIIKRHEAGETVSGCELGEKTVLSFSEIKE